MKRFFVLTVCLLAGCATMEANRNIGPGLFNSNEPELSVSIDPSFIYVGSFKLTANYDPVITNDYYIWRAPEKTAYVMILISDLQYGYFWYEGIFKKDSKHTFSISEETIAGHKWQTRMGLYPLSEKEDTQLHGMGIDMGRASMGKIWARKCSKELRVFISYIEQIDRDGTLFKQLNNNLTVFSESALQTAQEFEPRAIKHLKILK